jgi:hypothetical protein
MERPPSAARRWPNVCTFKRSSLPASQGRRSGLTGPVARDVPSLARGSGSEAWSGVSGHRQMGQLAGALGQLAGALGQFCRISEGSSAQDRIPLSQPGVPSPLSRMSGSCQVGMGGVRRRLAPGPTLRPVARPGRSLFPKMARQARRRCSPAAGLLAGGVRDRGIGAATGPVVPVRAAGGRDRHRLVGC